MPETYFQGEFELDKKATEEMKNQMKEIDVNNETIKNSINCWKFSDDGKQIIWNEEIRECYDYIAWIQYIVDKLIIPNGYVLNGEMHWHGEDYADMWKLITIKNNRIIVYEGKIVYNRVVFDSER